MTESTRDTIPSPRASSLPPEKTDRELLLDALVILRRMDSELAQHGIQLTEAAGARDEFRQEMRDKADTLIAMQAKLSEDVLTYVQKVVAVDFRQREHEHGNDHCESAACELRKLSTELKKQEA